MDQTDYTEKTLRRINRYEGIVINVTMDSIRLSDGSSAFREVVEHPGGVCVLPIDSDGYAWCVRQFRYPSRRHLLEAPAGKMEKGEAPIVCAVRELSEETGFTSDRLIPLGGYYTSPGYSTEMLHLFLALDLHRGQAHLDAGEFLDVVRIPFEELLGMVTRGEIPDAKTVICVLQAQNLFRSQADPGLENGK